MISQYFTPKMSSSDRGYFARGSSTFQSAGLIPARKFVFRIFPMRAGRIRISTVGTNEPIHYQLENARHLIPVDRGDDHNAMRRDPARIDFMHPVPRLPEVMIRITTTGPMAKWHRGGDTCFTWINHASVLRCQHAEIEQINFASLSLPRKFFLPP